MAPLVMLAMPVKESHFALLAAPTGEDGLLTVTVDGATLEIDVLKNKDQPLKVGNTDVTVRAWGPPSQETGDYWVRFETRRPGRDLETWQVLAFDFDHPLHRVGAPDPPDPGMTA